MHGKLATVIDGIEHGHHVFRAYFKNAFLKQYEKFFTFLRKELVSNNLTDFRSRKDWTTSRRSASASKPSSGASLPSSHSGSNVAQFVCSGICREYRS